MSRLKEIRDQYGITQEQMGLYLGLSRTFVAQLEFTNASIPSRLDERLTEIEAMYALESSKLDGQLLYHDWILKEIKTKFEKIIRTNKRLLVEHEKELIKLKNQNRVLIVHIRVINNLIEKYGPLGAIFMRGFSAIQSFLDKKFRICGPEAQLLLQFRIKTLQTEVERAEFLLSELPAPKPPKGA